MTLLGDEVGEIVLFGFAYFFEPEEIALIKFENGSRMWASDGRGMLEGSQFGLFKDIDLEGDFSIDDEIQIVCELDGKGF